MWFAEKSLIFFAVLCFYSNVCALESRSFRKEWKFHGNALFKYGQDIAADDNSFLYAICSEDKLPVEMNCNVTIETPIFPWNDTRTRHDTCQLKLIGSEVGKLRHEVTGIASLERFAKDRAILVWWERQQDSQYEIQNIRVSILHIPHCTTTHLTYPIDVDGHVLLSNVIVYPDTFDVTVSNKAICRKTPACRITHNVDGQRIGDPVPFVPNFAIIHTEPVSITSPAKGFYVCGSDISSWKFRAMHVSPTGHGTNLMTVSVSDPRQVQYANSNAHELYGICVMGDRRIHCAQFDAGANVKMNATLRIPGHTQWMAVHNLAESGILLLTGKCVEHKCRSFKVTRVLGNGQQGKQVDVPGLHIKCLRVPQELAVDVAENGSDFCFYFACSHVQSVDGRAKSSVKFSSKCVPKEELKV